MSAVGGVLIRRSTELVSAQLQRRDQSQMSRWLSLSILILTSLAFIVAIICVDYTCAHVVAALAAVEEFRPNTYIRLDNEDPNTSYDPSGRDVEAASTTKPITSGLLSTVKHLRARGGIWSCFRGFRMYLAFTGGDIGIGFLLTAITPFSAGSFIDLSLGQFVGSMLLATWQMAWVHLVIADKSPRSSYRRMLGLQNWPKIAPAAAVYNILMCAAFSLPMAAINLASATVTSISADSGYKKIISFLAVSILPAIFSLLISVPAKGIFTRVAASMLPEEDDPIVPFDRLFSGKVKPEAVAGGGKLSLMDAWTTFEWAARIRYVKIILKTLAIEVALGVVGILLVMGELALISPPSHSSSSPRI